MSSNNLPLLVNNSSAVRRIIVELYTLVLTVVFREDYECYVRVCTNYLVRHYCVDRVSEW